MDLGGAHAAYHLVDTDVQCDPGMDGHGNAQRTKTLARIGTPHRPFSCGVFPQLLEEEQPDTKSIACLGSPACTLHLPRFCRQRFFKSPPAAPAAADQNLAAPRRSREKPTHAAPVQPHSLQNGHRLRRIAGERHLTGQYDQTQICAQAKHRLHFLHRRRRTGLFGRGGFGQDSFCGCSGGSPLSPSDNDPIFPAFTPIRWRVSSSFTWSSTWAWLWDSFRPLAFPCLCQRGRFFADRVYVDDCGVVEIG